MSEDMKYFYEAEMARSERHLKRLWIMALVLIFLLVGSNIAWIVYEKQFEDISFSQEVENDNGNAAVSIMGDVDYNGEN